MSTAIKSLRRSSTLAVQIRQAKAILRGLRATLEDLEDHAALVKAKKKNAGKPTQSWREVAKEFGLVPPPARKR